MLSSALLIACVFIGADISVHSVEVEFMVSDHVEFSFHPIIHVELPINTLAFFGCQGFCFWNIVATPIEYREQNDFLCILAHELRHSEQWMALGPSLPIVSLLLPIEQDNPSLNWSDIDSFTDGMWQPPQFWPFEFDFLSIKGI